MLGINSFALNPLHFTINRVTAPYFIVDSNTPTTITKAYVGFEVINNSNSATTYTNLTFTVTSIGTSVAGQNYSILSPVSNTTVVGTLAPGQSKVCYFYVQYPANVTPIATFNVRLNDLTATAKTQAINIYNRSSISANAGGAATQSFTNQDILGGIITDDVTYTVGNAQNGNEVDFQISVSALFDPTRMSLNSTTITASTVPGITTGVSDSLYFISGNGGNGQTVTVRWTFRIIGTNFTSYLLPCAGATSGNTNYKYTLNTNLGADGTPVTISSAANPLTLTKTSDKTSYYICDTATFTITISNPSIYGVSVDSITDQLPAGFSFIELKSGSTITTVNSNNYPTSGATGNINFIGGINVASNTSYFIPAGSSIQLIYTAKATCTAAANLTTNAGGYIGAVNFANGPNTISVTSLLGVSWLNFDAKQQQKNIVLNWSTANELNTKLFIVQHSMNATDWTEIGSVDASGNTTAAKQYNFLHQSPSLGYNYYRLIQTDLDGKSGFSKSVSVNLKTKSSSLMVYSNPVINGNLKIRLEKSETIYLMNIQGQVLLTQNLSAGLQTINTGNLASGIYHLKAGNEIQKILIQ